MELFRAILPFVVIMGLMYVLMIRPQQKKAKETQNMLNSLKKGDSIVTIGGLHGVVDEITEPENTVVIDCEGIYLTFERRAVARIVTKSEAVTSTQAEELGTNTPEESVDGE
ncbi:MAG: preprotein translocase subunit YajC [Alkalibacterium gilvum]|uniref:Preprotein translocase subunit YajC n=1 Tax=Alkalibacterium gilvum TaxID=1130080 RepID=A0A1H6USD2_9LACT|nr:MULTISPECIES: preprotein translocase subunit YajC [Alkalibacterium]MDN6293257.1 preprotein translocase subunit YajC [Alkalibacterium sp.]MDN6294993.1 preprotein translocase subunit YajC [Alkalibacterium sp.]MDN6385423.1 preprotein translocase subunit YajC [Alkalibacterium sp.]MDN6398598.1 preprotein translocase subunit YajC [Alkalibacterium sp.]SEI91190.1 preprotein translocase subunit YajC [Alkalibacterium gilvum]